jgi:hypothetical protein
MVSVAAKFPALRIHVPGHGGVCKNADVVDDLKKASKEALRLPNRSSGGINEVHLLCVRSFAGFRGAGCGTR